MKPWVSLLRVSEFYARIRVRVECECRTVRGDRAMIRRDEKDRYLAHLRCVEHAT